MLLSLGLTTNATRADTSQAPCYITDLVYLHRCSLLGLISSQDMGKNKRPYKEIVLRRMKLAEVKYALPLNKKAISWQPTMEQKKKLHELLFFAEN